MKCVGIADLKAHLSNHLRSVQRGETLVIVDRETPVARVVPYTGAAGGLVTRRPRRELHAVKFPRRLGADTDSLSLLLEERQGER